MYPLPVKKGSEWYSGGMINWDARDLTLDLSFLGNGNYKAELFTDGKQTVKLAHGGGFAERIYQ